MNKIFRMLGCASLMLMALAACSPEDYDSANQAGIPKIEDINIAVEVDQETNNVTFAINNPGCYPIWTIEGVSGHPTTNGLVKNYVVAGTYSYSVQLANRNGVAEGSYSGTVTINETRYDFSDAIQKLTDGSSKEWRIYASKAGHMGCGESLTNPANWWAAAPNDKINDCIYDDRLTFTKSEDGGSVKFSYSAGEDGYTFMNKGVTVFPGSDGNNDFNAPAVGNAGAITDGVASLGYDSGNDMVTFTLPAKALFPYLADDAQFNNATEYYITDINNKTITVVLNLPGISWQFILINGEDEAVEEEFDPARINWCAVDSPENLGAGFNTKGTMGFWWANAGWAQIGDPGFSFANGVYTINVTDNGGSEWQAQCSINEVPLKIEAEAYYDISCKITASQSIDRITIKVNKDPDVQNDPNTLLYDGKVSLKKGENIIRFAKRMATDAEHDNGPTSFDQAKFILDLGGAPVGAELQLSDIIIQKHNPK